MPVAEKTQTLEEQGYKLAGNIGVDGGLCWIGDPCYVLHRRNGLPSTLGKDWGEFCNLLFKDSHSLDYKSFNYEMGHEGLGVVTSTGFGDGFYPVYVKEVDAGDFGKRIAEIRVVFIDEEELAEAREGR